MGHTAWAIMMFVTLMIYLAMIPSDIRKEKYTSAGFNIIMAIFSASMSHVINKGDTPWSYYWHLCIDDHSLYTILLTPVG